MALLLVEQAFLIFLLPLQVGRDGERGLHGAEEFSLLLHDLRETLFHQTVEDLVDFLAGDLRAGGEFEGLEARVADQHKIGARLVGVQADLLQPPPEFFVLDIRQISDRLHHESRGHSITGDSRLGCNQESATRSQPGGSRTGARGGRPPADSRHRIEG